MRTYTDYQAWKTAARARGWSGPHTVSGNGMVTGPRDFQFVGPNGTEALWNNTKNRGYIFDEQETQPSAMGAGVSSSY